MFATKPRQVIEISMIAVLAIVVVTQISTNNVYSTNFSTTISVPVTQENLTTIFKNTEKSVVQITSTVSTVDSSIIVNGYPLQGQSTRLGSGFIYDTNGDIITNNHVVDGSKTVNVTFVEGNTYTAKVIGTDPYNDIAVIHIIDNFTGENLAPLVLANSSQLEVGQGVAAIGNPYGLSDTMTHGIISQMGRLLNEQSAGGFSIPDVIQTDAAINPGNSGGPLLDMRGEVIGMNTAIRTISGAFSGIGFAIPSNDISRIVPYLIKDGSYKHPWLGITGTSVNPEFAKLHGLPRNYHGVVVEQIVKDSPAQKAGLVGANVDQNNNVTNKSDIIIAVDGHPVKTIYDIISYMDEHKSVGDKIVLTVNRDGKTIDLNTVLLGRPNRNS
ncbi:S1C family serine protease [Candidatus Nitrosotalea okcheonensis]|uniref:2-alkenal reductase n=1 Tax=Candidatus Nitrosotalea okcheonensis TaxID=1903276 RepID=A0A2H1FI24_9ARCH|nr:trypsin-like peptidase domain-containing protein [Candidatus Nitrosotalea okcheonensis]SMH72415.1 2-alkenal reductase [Candidatus Nitrosotalea okcheonensis]